MKFRSLRLCGEEEAATATAVIVVVAAEVEVVVVVRWLPVQSSVVDPVVDVVDQLRLAKVFPNVLRAKVGGPVTRSPDIVQSKVVYVRKVCTLSQLLFFPL